MLMNTLTTILYLGIELSVTTGAVAFVLTVMNLLSGFPLFIKVLLKPTDSEARINIVYFLSTFAQLTGWLIYLWPLENLLVNVALAVEIIWAIMFLSLAFSFWIKK
jgi:hypothetical protein